MKKQIFHILLLFGIQAISAGAFEIYPFKKVYSIYQDKKDIGNYVNVVARVTISTRTGNLGNGGLTVELAPNITHREIINTSDILKIIPSVADLCIRDFPDQPIETFSVDIRLVRDLWDEYRRHMIKDLNEAPGKIEFKSNWFQGRSQIFISSSKNISSMRKTASETFKALTEPIVMISNEISFLENSIGLEWESIKKSPGLSLASPPVIAFISKFGDHN